MGLNCYKETIQPSIRYNPDDFDYLVNGVAQVLVRRGKSTISEPMVNGPNDIRMQDDDVELVRDVFWDLFRQGFITLGRDANTPMWPWFRISHHAHKTLATISPWRFHDRSSYLELVRREVPDLSQTAIVYLQEAVAAYYSDCVLSSCVMLGVAAEVEFLRLITEGLANNTYSGYFAKANQEKIISQKIIKFQAAVESIPKELLREVGEDLRTNLDAVQSVLRIARNEAGHAKAATAPTREQVYIYLQLFIPFAAQLYRFRTALN